jgi:hypothetical protein
VAGGGVGLGERWLVCRCWRMLSHYFFATMPTALWRTLRCTPLQRPQHSATANVMPRSLCGLGDSTALAALHLPYLSKRHSRRLQRLLPAERCAVRTDSRLLTCRVSFLPGVEWCRAPVSFQFAAERLVSSCTRRSWTI